MCHTQRNDSRWWNGLKTIPWRWNVAYKQWRLFYSALLSSTCLSSCKCAYKRGTCQSINLEMCAPNDRKSHGFQTRGSTKQLSRPSVGKRCMRLLPPWHATDMQVRAIGNGRFRRKTIWMHGEVETCIRMKKRPIMQKLTTRRSDMAPQKYEGTLGFIGHSRDQVLRYDPEMNFTKTEAGFGNNTVASKHEGTV